MMDGVVRKFAPRPRSGALGLTVTIIGGLVVAGFVAWWSLEQPPRDIAAPMPTAPAPAPATPATPSAPTVAVATPAPIPEPQAVPTPAGESVPTMLDRLLGHKAVLSYLQIDDLSRRIAVTADNLARPYAAASLWPVNPTAGRFTVVERNGRTFVDADNGLRYAPLVQLIERMDMNRALDIYVALMPQLQGSFELLGYPGQRFHGRLVAVIDHLLQAPIQTEPLEVKLTEVHGPFPSQRPWVRYELTDPALEEASAGWKILWRTGPVNHRRLRAKLIELRHALEARGAGNQR